MWKMPRRRTDGAGRFYPVWGKRMTTTRYVELFIVGNHYVTGVQK